MTARQNAAALSLPLGWVDAARRLLGAAGVLLPDDDLSAYATDATGQWQGRPAAVLRPTSTLQVSQVVRLCADTGVSIVPQGGHTGLVGGATPDESGTQIVLSLSRMRQVREVDPVGDTMTVEAGVILADAQNAATAAGRLLPLSLASQGSCTIGGNLATNAGGIHVLRYGMARDLALGLEVVLADGRIWNGLSQLRKDNSGYDLTRLFIGSEGTLGVITAASLRLFPLTPHRATALTALPDVAAAVALLDVLRAHAGETLTAFELISGSALTPALHHLPGARDPFSRSHSWYGLVELAGSSRARVEAELEAALTEATHGGLLDDTVVATAAHERAQWWRLREGLTEGERLAGPSLKFDIAVPIATLADFVSATEARLRAVAPGLRIAPFGHAGDGNLHYNLGAPAGWDRTDLEAIRGTLSDIVEDEVHHRGGSISAEHGLGRLKRTAAARLNGDVELSLMRSVKAALDPQGILNPGVLLPD